MVHSSLPPTVRLGAEVAEALQSGGPVVALETAVVTHGLPEPHNVEVAELMERDIRQRGAVPATCLVADGALWIGASAEQVRSAAGDPRRIKASVRDLGAAIAIGTPAGLTVSATLFAAELVGISVFATGGIGGVHQGATETGDISTDLHQLSRSAVLTVCAGAKSILDLPRTLEYLETAGVPVFGYRTDTFPAFYLPSSGLPIPRFDTVSDLAIATRSGWELGYTSGVVVANPIPKRYAIDEADWERWLGQAMRDAAEAGVRGKDVTPFLLARVAELSEGKTVKANIQLLLHNAYVAAEIACALKQ